LSKNIPPDNKNKKQHHPSNAYQAEKRMVFFVLLIFYLCSGSAPEQKADAPKTAKTYKRIYDTAYNRSLTSENPCDDIELKKSDRAPVERADDY